MALPGSDPAILAADADSDSYVDYTRTQLSYAALSGSWAPTGTGDAVCGYRLAENMVVYQGSALFVQILVDNPSTAYSKQAAENVWKLELVGKGFGSELTRTALPARLGVTRRQGWAEVFLWEANGGGAREASIKRQVDLFLEHPIGRAPSPERPGCLGTPRLSSATWRYAVLGRLHLGNGPLGPQSYS